MTTTATAPPSLPPYSDDPDAPVIFADELTGGGVIQGNLNLTFSVLQYNHDDPPSSYRRTCLRLVIPVNAMPAAAQFISLLLQSQPPTHPATPVTPQNVH